VKLIESWRHYAARRLKLLLRHEAGTSAVEFAIVAVPFFMLLTGFCQLGIYYMTQAALDAGVIKTIEILRTNFTTGTSAVLPSGAALKAYVVANSGGLISNNSTLSVEIRQLSSLSSSSVAIVDGTADYGSTSSTLVLRAQSQAVTFAPGFGSLSIVNSTALVRRQGT
jgi:Flp pilus assembly protein TadG